MHKIGIDLGGTKIEGILLDEKYNTIQRKRIETHQENGYDSIVKSITSLVNELKAKPPVAKIKGDTSAGKAAYMICQTCHGAKGEGNKALNAPKLINQQDWYMVRQLKGFKEGLRGTHPKDVYGMQMRPMSMTLADDKAINNVVSYIVTFK